MKKLIVFGFIAACIFTACYRDNVEELNPGQGLFTPCDSSAAVITYSNHIVPIMQNFCYSCHSGSNPSSGIRIDTWDVLQQYAVTGELMGRIHGAPGYNPMPQSFPLDACNQRTFEKWVQSGALNN